MRELGDDEVSPRVFDAVGDIERHSGTHEPRCKQPGASGVAWKDAQREIAGHRGEARGADRIDEDAEVKRVLDEGLHARAGASVATVAKTENYAVAGFQVAVDHVHNDRLLVGSLVAFLIEADFERADARLAFAREGRARLVGRGDVVGRGRIARLKKRPVGVELEHQLKPAAVGETGRADLVGRDQFDPFAGAHLAMRERGTAEEGQRFKVSSELGGIGHDQFRICGLRGLRPRL